MNINYIYYEMKKEIYIDMYVCMYVWCMYMYKYINLEVYLVDYMFIVVDIFVSCLSN